MAIKNKDRIISNLEEAIEQLQKTVFKLRENKKLSEIELQIYLEHAYHHINFAWNIRYENELDVITCSKENFIKWSKFPIGEIEEYK